jgi:twitching motility protein PilJ
MEKLQEREESLSMSEQLPSFIPVESQKNDLESRDNQGVFAFFKKASLRSQQFFIASTGGIISFFTVVAISQLLFKTILQPGITTLSQLALSSLVALVTAVAVGGTTFVLGLVTANQLNRGIDDLQAQFNALTDGDFGVQATVYSQKELGRLATSFNQMTVALYRRLNKTQQEAKEQEKIKEELQSQLTELQHVAELATEDRETIESEVLINKQDDEQAVARGTLLDFLDNIQSNFQASMDSIPYSTTREELQQHKEQLQYRKAWLQALLNETQRELKLLSKIFESPKEEIHNK